MKVVSGLGQVDHHRRYPGHADLVAVDHAQGQDRRDAGINRIATGFEHLDTGQRRLLMPGADAELVTTGYGNDRHGVP